MDLKWNDDPVTPYVFSRDVFDKFSLAPNIKELYALLQSSNVKTEETGEKKPNGPSAEAQPVTADEDSDVSNIPPPDKPTSESTPSQKPTKPRPAKTKEALAFPEPLVPYPCFTSISANFCRTYLGMLNSRNYNTASRHLMQQVRNEVTEFMKYLQDVSRVCADRYNYMPPGGTRYSEEYVSACLEQMKSYPQVYSIQEITSLTSVKLVCDISLNFEKQLLAMGTIDVIGKKVIENHTQLPVDYESVSNEAPPAKKVPTAISSDSNAEKLSATYEPHVCLSKEAFVQLLNHGSEFTEAWELPVCVRTRGSSKTAYIDPPLLKSEMSVRDRSLLFHQESVRRAFRRTSTRPIFFLTSEKLDLEMEPSGDKSSRSVVEFDDTAVDFEMDLTDLESFGESYKPSKKPKEPKSSQLTQSPPKKTDSSTLTKHTPTSQNNPLESPMAQEKGQTDPPLADGENVAHPEKESDSKVTTETTCVQFPPSKRPRRVTDDKKDQDSDSDDERLVIDHIVSPPRLQGAPVVSSPDPGLTNPPNKGARKGVKRARVSGECDQLGQILRMQDAMLKSTPSKSQESVKTPVPEEKTPEAKTHSLVKQCVSSYLESRDGQEDTTLPADVPVHMANQKKYLLKEDLKASAEDVMDYDPPAEGSVLYKLYSLLDVLLLVRSRVDVGHARHDTSTFRVVPVHVLPKLEYQLCYGAESLTHTEACQLWAETLLHSSTESYISRINAHTSEMFQMQKLPDDWIQNITCDFVPIRSLNTLYHILKKVSGLQEGRYLLVHKPREGFVTIYKASDDSKAARGVYQLQAVHSGPPVVPPGVPWVPLDPSHVLPFHQKHNRPPCLFPPPPTPQGRVRTGPYQWRGRNAVRPQQETSSMKAANQKQSPKKKKKKKKNNMKNTHKKNAWMDNVKVKMMKDLQKNQSGEGEKTPL